MPIPLGILAQYRPSAAAGDYELISSTILTGSQSSVTFSNLGDYSSTYKHLQIRYVAKANAYVRMGMRINGASTSYESHGLFTRGSSVASYAAGSTYGSYLRVAQDLTTDAWQAGVIDLLDPFAANKNRVFRAFAGHTGTNNLIGLASGAYFNTGSVTSITLAPSDFSWSESSFPQYSRFSLYGIKG